MALQDLADHPFRIAELYGKLANIFADLDPRQLQSSSMFKMLTTGDPLTAERKFGQPFTFRNYAKLLFSANETPTSRDRSYAFYRRWLMIPLPGRLTARGKPLAGHRSAGQAPGGTGILNRALLGLERVMLQGLHQDCRHDGPEGRVCTQQ